MLNIDYDGTLDLQRYQHWKKKNERLYSNQLLFPNGYGISIVCNAYSYGGDEGLFKVAVMREENGVLELDYSTPIMNDTVGFLGFAEVQKYIDAVKMLPQEVKL